jgi:hypothetical protein
MKVWEIEHDWMGKGYIVDDPEIFEYELSAEELKEPGESLEYAKEEIKPFLERCLQMKPGKELSLGDWTIRCFRMLKWKYKRLPEFGGW